MLVIPSYLLAYPNVAQIVQQQGIFTQLAGVLTQNSTTISGLSSTTGLTAGMAVYGAYIQPGSVIVSVGSTSIVINQAAQLTTTSILSFPTSTNNNILLDQVLAAAQSIAESYCGFKFEQLTAMEWYSGHGYPDIILRRPWVTNVSTVSLDNVSSGQWGQYGLQTLNGTITAGSPIITNIASTANLVVGQLVLDAYPPQGTGFPLPTYILTINSPTSITLTQNALVNNTSFVVTGCFNQNQNLTVGSGYALVYEGNYAQTSNWNGNLPNSFSPQALLRFMPYAAGGSYGYYGWGGYGWGQTAGLGGSLTLQGWGNGSGGGWPGGTGNVLCVYTAGWIGTDQPEPNVPQDILTSICQLAMFIIDSLPYGGSVILQSEGLSKYNYTLSALNSLNALASTRSILSRYRALSI